MLVLFIAGVALSIVSVYFSRAYEKTVFREEIKRVHNMLRQARNAALLERGVITFNIAGDGTSVWLEKNGSQFGDRRMLSAGTKVKGETIAFFPKGDSSGGSVIIETDGREYEIEVDPVTGSAKVKRSRT